MSTARGWFVVSLAAWTAFAVLITAWVDVNHLFDGRRLLPASDFFGTLIEMYGLGLLTPLLIYVVHRAPPTRRPAIVTLAAYVVTILGASVAALPIFIFVSNRFLGRTVTLSNALGEGLFDTLIYAVLMTIIVATTQMRIANERLARALRLEADLSKLRVEALQRQLQPHFIFNTLNAIGAIMQTDVEAAEEMIAALADLLRTASDKLNRPLLPLREELQLLDRYTLIMKMRYGDRLVVHVSAEPKTLEVPFPTFTLQPLVENAIVHGLEKTNAGITIEVACRLENGQLYIDVNDDGATPDLQTLHEGVGIGNTRARLAELYGQQATLLLAPRVSHGMQLTLTVPTAPAL